LDALGAEIGVRNGDLSPWYRSHTKIRRRFSGIARLYPSVPQMLATVYSEYKWVPWKFAVTPSFVFHNESLRRSALAYVEKLLKIERPEQWYRVGARELKRLRVNHLLNRNGGLYATLAAYRPDFPWEETKFVGVWHFGQKLTGALLRRLFPAHSVLSDAELNE
jgi:hypothetical protein